MLTNASVFKQEVVDFNPVITTCYELFSGENVSARKMAAKNAASSYRQEKFESTLPDPSSEHWKPEWLWNDHKHNIDQQ